MQKISPLYFDYKAGRFQTKAVYAFSTVRSEHACRPSLVPDALAPVTICL